MAINQPFAASDPNSKAQQFNFFIGEWDIQQKILQRDGNWLELPAHTSVAPTLDGCALIEHWEGKTLLFWEGMEQVESRKGLSIRAYNPDAAQWSIYWMDTQNPFFRPTASGNFINGRGEFLSEEQTSGGKFTGRITFSDITPDSIHWDFALSDAEGGWQTLWIMELQRHA